MVSGVSLVSLVFVVSVVSGAVEVVLSAVVDDGEDDDVGLGELDTGVVWSAMAAGNASSFCMRPLVVWTVNAKRPAATVPSAVGPIQEVADLGAR